MMAAFTVTIERKYFEEILQTKPLFVIGKFEIKEGSQGIRIGKAYIPLSSIVCIHPDNNDNDTYNVIITDELKSELLKINIEYNRVYIRK